MVTLTPAFYPVNDTSLSEAERAYLQKLTGYAEQQDLTQNEGPEVRNLSIVFTALAVVIVGLRFLARHRQNAPYLMDDWLILVALAFLGGNFVMNMVLISQGLGLHSGLLTVGELATLNQVSLPGSHGNPGKLSKEHRKGDTDKTKSFQTVVGAEIIYVSTYSGPFFLA